MSDDDNVVDFRTKQDPVVLKVAEEVADLAPPLDPPGANGYTKRTNPVPHSLQELAKDYTVEAMNTLLEVMRDTEELGGVRIEAAKQILDRGWGKAPVKIDGTMKVINVHTILKDLADGLKDPPRLTEIVDVTAREITDA